MQRPVGVDARGVGGGGGIHGVNVALPFSGLMKALFNFCTLSYGNLRDNITRQF